MRIISGKWKGRRLYSVKGSNTRPTSDRVKEAVFNIIREKIEDSNILDIFAGTGSMGFEALSRGSNKTVFIERDIRAAQIIVKNAKMLECHHMIQIIKKDVFRALDDLAKSEYIFDIIFIDPPYSTNIEKDVILSILEAGIMDAKGIIILEHDYRDKMLDKIGEIVKFDLRKYGNTGISLYTKGDF